MRALALSGLLAVSIVITLGFALMFFNWPKKHRDGDMSRGAFVGGGPFDEDSNTDVEDARLKTTEGWNDQLADVIAKRNSQQQIILTCDQYPKQIRVNSPVEHSK